MFTTLIVFQVLLAIGLIAIVLVQRGPGATMGAAFGAGASGTVFGSRGAGNFLTRTTGWMALGFFAISLTLAVLATSTSNEAVESSLVGSVLEQAAEPQPEDAVDDAASTIDAVIDSLEQDSRQQDAANIESPAAQPDAEAATATEEQAPVGDDEPADGDNASGSGG